MSVGGQKGRISTVATPTTESDSEYSVGVALSQTQTRDVARSVDRSAKKAKTECDLLIDAEVELLNEWQRQHTFSESFEVSPEWMTQPDPKWAARTLSEAHVETLMASFRSTGKCNKGIIGCVANADVYNRWQELGTMTPAMQHKFIMDMVVNDPDLSIQVVSGDHSREALSRLHARKPHAKPWRSVKIELIITPDTEQECDNLRVIGVRENLSAECHLKHTYKDKLDWTRSRVEEWWKAYPGEVMPKSEKSNLKARLIFAWMEKVGSSHGLVELALRQGKCWELINDLYAGKAQPMAPTGRGKCKTIKTPSSYNPFVNAASLCDDALAILLQLLLDGQLTIKAFKERCEATKWTNWLMKKTADYCKTHRPGQVRLHEENGKEVVKWASIQEEWPAIDDEFVNRWVSFYTKSREGRNKTAIEDLPGAFYTALDAIITPPIVRICIISFGWCPP